MSFFPYFLFCFSFCVHTHTHIFIFNFPIYCVANPSAGSNGTLWLVKGKMLLLKLFLPVFYENPTRFSSLPNHKPSFSLIHIFVDEFPEFSLSCSFYTYMWSLIKSFFSELLLIKNHFRLNGNLLRIDWIRNHTFPWGVFLFDKFCCIAVCVLLQ